MWSNMYAITVIDVIIACFMLTHLIVFSLMPL